jgi:hypothetical protein
VGDGGVVAVHRQGPVRRGAGGRAHAAAVAGRALEYWLRSYRRTWRASAVTSVLAPLLYLGSLGFGLGSLVDDGSGGGVGSRTRSSWRPVCSPRTR